MQGLIKKGLCGSEWVKFDTERISPLINPPLFAKEGNEKINPPLDFAKPHFFKGQLLYLIYLAG